jgi:hypothetical protein
VSPSRAPISADFATDGLREIRRAAVAALFPALAAALAAKHGGQA